MKLSERFEKEFLTYLSPEEAVEWLEKQPENTPMTELIPPLILTVEELAALQDIVREWIADGFTVTPSRDEVSVVSKLGLEWPEGVKLWLEKSK